MLQAIGRNKARGFLLGGRTRRPTEDIVTDCVFGGLRYFAPSVAGEILAWMLPDEIQSGAEVLSTTLWPRRDGVEPDALISCRCAGGRLTNVLIEAKWGSNRLSARQIDGQWRAFGTGSIRAEMLHLAVVPTRASVDPDLLGRVWEKERRLAIVTWRDLATRLHHRPTASRSEATLWADDVVRVLAEMGQRPFRGCWTSLPDVRHEIGAPTFFVTRPGRVWPASPSCTVILPAFWAPSGNR